jgi:resuscitation-promoting factor RpfC
MATNLGGKQAMTLPSIAAGGVAKTLMAVSISLHPAAAHQAPKSVTVKPGDTLSSIAQREYGNQADWPALWWTNKHGVPNPGQLRIGQKLLLSSWHPIHGWLTAAAMKASGAGAPVARANPASATVPTYTSAAPVAYYSGSGGFQACVIRAESNGDASAVNPYSGAGGLYGFLPSTWQALGYSGLPEDASVATQNAAFAKEYAQSGGSAWSAYDGC